MAVRSPSRPVPAAEARRSAPYNREATAPVLRRSGAPGPERSKDGRPEDERARTRAALKVVEPDRRRRRSIGVLVASLCAVIFVGLLGLTGVQVALAQNQERLDQVNKELQQGRDYYDRLRLAVAKLQSPDYIVPAATKRLGMVPAKAPTYLTPTADVVNAVVAATGATITAGDAGTGAGRPEWGKVKENTGQLP